ncbi:MAG: hypothetical protein GX896_00715, partial [Clostridiales bacterium]|nr:hypothetical protein [Clostridiales bacterium]
KGSNLDMMDDVIKLAFGKKSKEILDMNMSFEAYQEIITLTMKALTGEEQDKPEERFPEITATK